MIDERQHRAFALARRKAAIVGFMRRCPRRCDAPVLDADRRRRSESSPARGSPPAFVLAEQHPAFRQQHDELPLVAKRRRGARSARRAPAASSARAAARSFPWRCRGTAAGADRCPDSRERSRARADPVRCDRAAAQSSCRGRRARSRRSGASVSASRAGISGVVTPTRSFAPMMRFRSSDTGAAAFAEPSKLTCQVSKNRTKRRDSGSAAAARISATVAGSGFDRGPGPGPRTDDAEALDLSAGDRPRGSRSRPA